MKFVFPSCMCIFLFSAASVSAQQYLRLPQVLTTLGKQGDIQGSSPESKHPAK